MTPTFEHIGRPRYARGFRYAPGAAVLVLLLFAASCSTAPKAPLEIDTVKNQAAQFAEAGNTYFDQGNYSQAQKFFNLALESNMSVYNEPGMVSSYNSLGKVYLAVRRLDQAEADFRNARSIAERINNSALIVDSSNNLGELLLQEGKSSEALGEFQGALAKVTDPKSLAAARLYHNIGSAYKNLGEYSNALSFLNRALTLHLDQKGIAQAASDYYMIASVYSKEHDYGEAMRNAKLALENDQKMENSPGIASDLEAMGIISEKSADLSDAYTSYYGSLQVYETIGDAGEVKLLLAKLEALATTLGRTEDARNLRNALSALEGSK